MAAEQALSLEDLRSVVRTCPVIDNHAHNLLRSSKLKTYDFLSSTTEAQGDALEDTPRSLSHLRAARQLRELYGCSDDATWNDLMKRRQELLDDDPDGLIGKCLEGTHTILMDDGINDDQTVHPYHWHDRFTTGNTQRIVRIEAVAADIMRELHEKGVLPAGSASADYDDCGEAWIAFLGAFEAAIAEDIRDDVVCGFKSVWPFLPSLCQLTVLTHRSGDLLPYRSRHRVGFRSGSCIKGSVRFPGYLSTELCCEKLPN